MVFYMVKNAVKEWLPKKGVLQNAISRKALNKKAYTPNPFPVTTTGISLCSNSTL